MGFKVGSRYESLLKSIPKAPFRCPNPYLFFYFIMDLIGTQLEQERKNQNISLREAADATKIRQDFLSYIERNAFDELTLPNIYIRGFIKSYAQFLKLNAKEILVQYDTYTGEEALPKKRQQRESLGYLDLSDTKESPTAAVPKEPEPPREEIYADRRPSSRVRRRLSIRPLHLIILGIAAFAGLLIFLLVRLFSPDDSNAVRSGIPSQDQSAALRVIEADEASQGQDVTFMASGDIKLTVTETDSKQVLFSDYLDKGEGITLTKKGQIVVAFDEGKNLIIKRNGRQSLLQIDGPGKISIP